jgi:uncharacterized DUF497 family protein
MEYEWDPEKAAANQRKHGIAFDLVHLFQWNDALVQIDERYAYGEQRFYALGKVEGRIFALIFVRRNGIVRVISFRKANDREKRRYDQG